MLTYPEPVLLALAVCLGAGLGYLLAHRRFAPRRRAGAAEELARASAVTGAPARGEQRQPSHAPGSTLDARYLFVSFEEEIRRARERSLPMTLLALSLEKAAERSAQQGPHDSQDRLLRSVAHAVRGQMRGCDTCIRYAASEFILILPGVPREEARRIEGRLRVALQGVSREAQGGFPPRVTLGSATFPEEGASFDQLLTLADSRRRRDGAAALSPAAGHGLAAVPFRVPPPTLSRN
jgi:diguanylate cyclase (GGDEF)-like protein